MADITFGDSSLFDVFEPADEPSDRLLLAKFKDEFQKGEQSREQSEKSTPVHIRFCSSSDSSDDELSERESGHGGKTVSESLDRPKSSDIVDRSGISVYSDSVLRGSSLNRPSEYSNSTSNSHGHCSLNGVPDDHYSQKKLEELKQDVIRLQYENTILKRHSRIINPEKGFTDQEGPALQVVFMNHYFSRKFKSDIEEFIGKLIEKEKRKRYNDLPVLEDLHSSVCIASQSDRPANPDEKIRHSRASTVIGCSQFYRDFAVDAMGWPLIQRNPSLTDGWEIPNYEQIYKMALPFVEEEVEDGPPKREKRPKPACFNCGGPHMIFECKEVKDHRKINQAKREFMDKCSGPGQPMKTTRYHVDEEMKYANIKPGVLGAEARKALGISDYQLPPYIYQMRTLGYPPGWLEEARIVKPSRLSMFGKDGQVVSDDAKALEEGELDTESTPDNNQFDTNKIIDYPGFNVDPPRGVIDEYEELGMQPMLPHQSKAALVLFLSPSGTNVSKRHLSGGNKPAAPKRQKVQHNLVDMDIESQESPAKRRLNGETVGETVAPALPPSTLSSGSGCSVYVPSALHPSYYQGSSVSTSYPVSSIYPPPPPPPPPPSPPPPLPDHSPLPAPPLPLTTPPSSPSVTDCSSPHSTQPHPVNIPLERLKQLGPGGRRGSASQSSSTRTSRSTTPTLEELEEQKLLLQSQLAHAEGGSVEVDVLDSCDSQEDDKLSSEDDAGRSRPGSGMKRVSSQASIDSSPQGSPFRIPFPVGSTTPATPAAESGWCPPLPAETPPATPPPPLGTPPTTPRSERPMPSGSALAETPGSPVGATPQTASSRLGSTSFSSMMSTPQSNNSLLRTPSSGGSISVAFGTPIDKENSGKKEGLPSSSQFAEGICQHIPFANLPNSTGTFERMRRVISSIRSKTKS